MLEMERTGEQITLRPVRGTGPLTKEHGVWCLFRTHCRHLPPTKCWTCSAKSATWRTAASRNEKLLDTSALVPVFYGDHVHHDASIARFIQCDKTSGCCAAHSLAEVYSTLTRMPGRHRISAEQAMLFIDSIRERLSAIALDGGICRCAEGRGLARHCGRRYLRRDDRALCPEGEGERDLQLEHTPLFALWGCGDRVCSERHNRLSDA